MEIGKKVCSLLQHNIGGELKEDGKTCTVETDEVKIIVLPDGRAKLTPKKPPEYEILKKYTNELRNVYMELGLLKAKEHGHE